MRRLVPYGLAALLVFGTLQLLPFGRVTNPPVTEEPSWPSREARDLAVAACYDCHSNETKLEWFDRIAPGSWLVASHVRDGRDFVNFSEWDRGQLSDDLDDVVEDGDMPPRNYTWLHPDAKLSVRERQILIDAFEQLEEAGDDDARRGRGRGGGGQNGGEG